MGDPSQPRNFLIDFAHIGEHHVFLDYVVMEVSVRFHLLGTLIQRVTPAESEPILKRWMTLERWLTYAADDPQQAGAPPCDIDVPGDPLARLARLVIWLRKNAWLHGFADSYYNYYGGTGMATLTSPFLPDSRPTYVRRAVRLAMFGCAAFCLDRVKNELKNHPGRTPLTDALASEQAIDSFATALLRTNLSRIQRDSRGEINAFMRELDGPARSLAAQRAESVLARLRSSMPKFGAAVQKEAAPTSQTQAFEREIGPATELFVASKVMTDIGPHGILEPLHNEVEDWVRSAWTSTPVS